jgi:hypothetical protein
MNRDKLDSILKSHSDWVCGNGGERADLRGADLRGADLRDANLRGADLICATLHGAALHDADLRDAALRGANLRDATLSGADLRGANLSGANLSVATLRDANLSGATLPHYQIPQHGELTVYKKVEGRIILLKIPSHAKRTASLVGRKCRASAAIVLAVEGDATVESRGIKYVGGVTVKPDSYDPDPRIECTHGIHFFLTREEAEEYDG